MRQLSRRAPRRRNLPHHSVNSEAAILGNELDRTSTQMDGSRGRSFSGSSALLLNRSNGPDGGASPVFDTGSGNGAGHSRSGSGPYTPNTPGTGAFSHATVPGHHSSGNNSPRAGAVGLKRMEPPDPYYRPPRQRRGTLEGELSTSQHRSSISGEWAKRRSTGNLDGEDGNQADGPSSYRGSLIPTYLSAPKDDPDGDPEESGRARTDYAVREVDFYYRVRGPALSNMPTRKLKTGPADPTGPVSSATGWFRNLLGGKTKDKAKGFEVVRSARAPPPGLIPSNEGDPFAEPYRDDPENPDNQVAAGAANKRDSQGPDNYTDKEQSNDRGKAPVRDAPASESREIGGAIELSNRTESKSEQPLRIRPPTVPRKSSKRKSATEMDKIEHSQYSQPESSEQPARLPFTSTKSSSTRSDMASGGSTRSSLRNHTPEDEVTTPKGGKTSDPSGLKYVHKHCTSDNIHETNPEHISMAGSSAEFIRRPSESS